ncbi:pentatricopeptide repeat-containing protein [Tanacetum coccineum]
MTISPSSSSDFSLASITKNHKKHIFIPSKTAQVLHFLSPISSTSSRILILNSSSSSYPPPILEDELDMKVQDFQDSEIPESENLNVLIISLLKDSETEETGFKYYQKAKRKADFVPKKTTLHYLIRYLMRLKDWNLVWSVSEDFRKFNVYPDAPSCCKLISGCIKARRFKLANNLLHILKFEKQVAGLSFNAAMKSYNKLHMYSSTVNVFEIMKSAGIQLDAESYGHTMEAYLKMGKNEIVVSLFKEFESSEAEWNHYHDQLTCSSRIYLISDFFSSESLTNEEELEET